MRQTSRSQRRLAAGAFLLIAAPVAMGSVAYACQSLATLHSNPGSVAAGGSVTVYGRNYSNTAGDGRASGAGTGSSNIVIHLDGRNGPVLMSVPPPPSTDSTRSISVSVTIPAGTSVGDHPIVATQYTAAGDAVSGTPGRANFAVTVAPRTTADGAAAGPVSASSAAPAATAAVTPAAAPTAASPAASAASASTAKAAATAAPVAPSAPSAAAAAPTAAAGSTTASGAVAATAITPAASDAAAATPTAINVGGILPAAASHGSSLPGLTLIAGLALVVLALGAFIKSGKSMLGRGFAPLAG